MVSFEILSKCLINGNSDSLRIRTEAVSIATRVRIFLHRAWLFIRARGAVAVVKPRRSRWVYLNNCVKEAIKGTKSPPSGGGVWARKLKDPWHIKR